MSGRPSLARPGMVAIGALLIAGLLMLTACGGRIQVQTQGYGDSYTQLGHD
jgi:hypothetical protein